jgi:Ras-related protein Rab-1A
VVSNEVQKDIIASRVDKTPKNFSPYEFDALYKIVLIGESNTGKTSMLLRFADNIFTENYLCTIGVDFKIKTLKVDDKIVKMQIWDTAGQERFRSISHAYYRNSHGCIALYDITSRASFDQLEEQI